MQEKILNKENILASLNEYDLLNHYLQPYHPHSQLKQGENISNPFLAQKQKTPSFNIYQILPNNYWRFKDFATNDEGDVFDLIMRLRNCDFKESLSIINQDFQLGLGIINGQTVKTEFSIQARNHFAEQELAYWNQYGISEEIMEQFNVKSLESYSATTKTGKSFTIDASQDNPIFAYEINKGVCYKVYRPLTSEKQYKFIWLGEKTSHYCFGYHQLPETGKAVFITGGEKDVLTLSVQGHHAIALNSETAMPEPELIKKLKKRFQQVIVLYDIDRTGMQQSEKICKRYGLSRMILPDKLKKDNGKDISDFVNRGYSLNDSSCQQEIFETHPEMDISPGSNLEKLLSTQKLLKLNKSKTITFSSPILKKDDQPVFYPNTINVLQGKAGIHKSRLAETICSALLQGSYCDKRLLDFKADIFQRSTVCYVDTERNLSEQLPYALQQIQLKAGYSIEEEPSNFDYISLLEISRAERFKTLTEYLEYVRNKYNNHIFIVLDVVTDCIKDFNRSEDSMQLIDLMNEAINKYNVTFLCLIHENPGSADKARGHLGTEIMNKASTVIQVSFEKGKNGEPTHLVCVKYLKCRNSSKHQPFYMEYNQSEKELVLADEGTISEVIQSRKQKAELSDLSEHLQFHLTESMPSRELIDELTKDFGCSDKIIRERLKELIQLKYVITHTSGNTCHLSKAKEGKEIIYSLIPIKDRTVENSLERQTSLV